MNTQDLLKLIRRHRTSAGRQSWTEQAAAWRLAQEQADEHNGPTAILRRKPLEQT